MAEAAEQSVEDREFTKV